MLTLSGRIGAGKSTITLALAEALAWPTASFGDFVRAQAAQRDLPADRSTLQAVGEELIATLGWPEFCERTLAHAGLTAISVPCIVEGIRHVPALKTLRTMFARPVYLVYLEASEAERTLRLRHEGVSNEQAMTWSDHSTERDVRDALPALADLSVTVEGSSDAAIDEILAWLSASSAPIAPDVPSSN